jgi:hypothetical protein
MSNDCRAANPTLMIMTWSGHEMRSMPQTFCQSAAMQTLTVRNHGNGTGANANVTLIGLDTKGANVGNPVTAPGYLSAGQSIAFLPGPDWYQVVVRAQNPDNDHAVIQINYN